MIGQIELHRAFLLDLGLHRLICRDANEIRWAQTLAERGATKGTPDVSDQFIARRLDDLELVKLLNLGFGDLVGVGIGGLWQHNGELRPR